GLHRDAVAGRGGRHVMAAPYHHGINEMLVQVIYELDAATCERTAHGDVVEDRKVLHVLAQAHAARVRADRHAELRGQEQHGDTFVDAAQPASVELAEAERTGLQELLEHDEVVVVLAGRHADGREVACDLCVTV